MYWILRRPKIGGTWEAVCEYGSLEAAEADCEGYRASKVYHYLVADERFCPWMPARREAV